MLKYKKEMLIDGKSAGEIYDRVAAEIDGFLKNTPLPSYEIKNHAESSRVEITSSMFSGYLICEDGMLRVDAKLSLIAVPFKGQLDNGIEKWAAKAFS